jgi:hypothetical protein
LHQRSKRIAEKHQKWQLAFGARPSCRRCPRFRERHSDQAYRAESCRLRCASDEERNEWSGTPYEIAISAGAGGLSPALLLRQPDGASATLGRRWRARISGMPLSPRRDPVRDKTSTSLTTGPASPRALLRGLMLALAGERTRPSQIDAVHPFSPIPPPPTSAVGCSRCRRRRPSRRRDLSPRVSRTGPSRFPPRRRR